VHNHDGIIGRAVRVGIDTHVTEGKRNIRAAWIIVLWVDIFGFGFWAEAC
jgi:hypothetical protein